MIALPAWLEWSGHLYTNTRSANQQQVSCAQVTAPLVDLIKSNAMEYPRGVQQEQKMKAKVQSRNCEKAAEEAEAVKASLTKDQQNAVEQASERGASTWLTAIPMTKYGFQLNKQAFRDTVCLRYGWMPERLSSHCRPMWGGVLSGTCFWLSKRSLAFNQA